MPPEMIAENCLGEATILEFQCGQLTDAEIDLVAAHLTRCDRCSSMVQELQAHIGQSDLQRLLKQCLDEPLPPDQAGWNELADRAEMLTVSGGPQLPLVLDEAKAARAWVGQTVGPCVLLRQLGQGGMGVVYEAMQQSIQRVVALKMVLAGAHAPPHLMERFVTEGRALARLEHPNVVRLYDFAEHEGLPYFTMELVTGGSLRRRLEDGPLPVREAVELVRTVATAVEHAHRQHVLHRDLKPSNILLSEDGSPRIADFGLAKLIDVDATYQTQSGAVLGTLSYMAPEQASGDPSRVGPTADVYSLGAILYASLTCRPPLVADNPIATLELVRTAEPEPPSRYRSGIDRRLDAICLKCLEKSPAQRYEGAQALADDLGLWLAGKRPAGIPGQVRRAGKALWAYRVEVALAVVLVASMIFLRVTHAEKPEEAIRRTLLDGRTATLMPEAGEPAYSRVRLGAKETQTSVGNDRVFTVHTGATTLVELLPDPQFESFRFRAQVRHLRTGHVGYVGLYFARVAHPRSEGDIQYYVTASFNEVFIPQLPRVLPLPPLVPPGWTPPLPKNNLRLRAILETEEVDGKTRGADIGLVDGVAVKPVGQYKASWRELEVLVTPDLVAFSLDGQWTQMSRAKLRQQIDESVEHYRLLHWLHDPALLRLDPTVRTRGGLGLYLYRSTAAFRSVTVTPLRESP